MATAATRAAKRPKRLTAGERRPVHREFGLSDAEALDMYYQMLVSRIISEQALKLAFQGAIDGEFRFRPDSFAAKNGSGADDRSFDDYRRFANQLIVGGQHDGRGRGGGSEKHQDTRRPVHPEVLQHWIDLLVDGADCSLRTPVRGREGSGSGHWNEVIRP